MRSNRSSGTALSCVKIVALNGLTDGDVVIHPEGLSSSEGDVRFLDRGYASRIPRDEKELRVSLSTRWKKLLERIGLRKPKNRGPKVLTIPTITLDMLVRRIGQSSRSSPNGCAGIGSGSPERRRTIDGSGRPEIIFDRHS